MAPYFEIIKSYADVPLTDQGVETSSFLEASDGMVKMFDLLGVAVFEFVRADLSDNISAVRAWYESTGRSANTLESLVRSESQRNDIGPFVRLIRGLSLTCKALQYMQKDPNTELYICFQKAFDQVLRPHLSWYITPFIYLAIRSVPHRREFYSRLVQGGDAEKFEAELSKWLAGLDGIVKHFCKFLEQSGFERV